MAIQQAGRNSLFTESETYKGERSFRCYSSKRTALLVFLHRSFTASSRSTAIPSANELNAKHS
ncbi:hypothetical protein T4E_1321 [Trichinella pseudospiralis]|uniref:Uncharacterized protein n=1 Tax=Trichinella pseudospiralis TaxID=6337 RepID=A0A0V0YEX6_TRIPS|nr:hypothetical protein T4E_1321 [Trichinella pseudospiralis]